MLFVLGGHFEVIVREVRAATPILDAEVLGAGAPR